MGKIYTKALKQQQNEVADEVLAYLKQLDGDDNWRVLLFEKLDAMKSEPEKPTKKVYEKHAWDFSAEKAQSVFATDGVIALRPFRGNDRSLYYAIRKQWYTSAPESMFSDENDILWSHTQEECAFFCMVEIQGKPVGYVAIHDTRESLWEFAVEFDKDYCYNGLGPKSILLFLRKIEESTMISLFKARVEVDNIACQKCMRKIGAELTGLGESFFRDEKKRELFEEENLDLIDEHICELAEQLNVEPRQLLTHVLVYEIQE